jgi:hypothetical protein
MRGNNSDANGKQSRNTCSEIFSDSKLNDAKAHGFTGDALPRDWSL